MNHKTSIDLGKGTRAKIIELLDARLADALDLQSHAKQAHWNVRGPAFIALHELFDRVSEAVEGHVDDLAERIAQLGGSVSTTSRAVAKASSLKDYPADAVSGPEHVAALSASLSSFGAKARKAIDVATKAEDAGTADLFTQISRSIDQQLWFVEAHAQAKA
jgi:starvation-inducible DNA-binding protein